MSIRVHSWFTVTPGFPFASSRLRVRPTACKPLPRGGNQQSAGRRGQISGWKARATFIRAHSCPFVVHRHPCVSLRVFEIPGTLHFHRGLADPQFGTAGTILRRDGHPSPFLPTRSNRPAIDEETAHSLLPISAARQPPPAKACFLPRSFRGEGATGYSAGGIAAELQSTKPQNSSVAGSTSHACWRGRPPFVWGLTRNARAAFRQSIERIPREQDLPWDAVGRTPFRRTGLENPNFGSESAGGFRQMKWSASDSVRRALL